MHQSIPLVDLQQRSRCSSQLQTHGFCSVEGGESHHDHDDHGLFEVHTKHYRLNNGSLSSQGTYGQILQSPPSNEDVSTESSRGSTDREDLEAFGTRGAPPHRSAEQSQCPPPHKVSMETDKLLHQSAGIPHVYNRDQDATLRMAYTQSSSRYPHILPSGPIPPINDAMLGQMEFELAFTGTEMGVHIAGTVVVSALIALSVWLTVANITL